MGQINALLKAIGLDGYTTYLSAGLMVAGAVYGVVTHKLSLEQAAGILVAALGLVGVKNANSKVEAKVDALAKSVAK